MLHEEAPLWEPLPRILHWILAATITADFFLEDDLHNWIGHGALVTLFIRLFWGLKKNVHRENALARIIYCLIWIDVIALALTGWLYGTDRFWGEDWLSDLHARLADGMLILVGLHVLGVAVDSLRNRRKTWMAMISGFRPHF